MTTILVSGGCGFLGSHLCEHILRRTNWNVVILDKLTYASNGLERIRDSGVLDNTRVRVFTIDLASGPLSEGLVKEIGDVHYIVHTAAETHIPHSIEDPVGVIHNNVMSTVYLLEYARQLKNLKRFLAFSTDEVYGGAPPGVDYVESDRHNPTNPYSASKSAAEQICVGYRSVYDIPLIVVNAMNIIGQRQHPEKYLIKCINHIMKGETIQVHADPSCTSPGSRFYIHARNVSDAVLFLIDNGEVGEVYHITGEKEVDNLELAKMISVLMKSDLKYDLVDFHSLNHGHDERYSLSGAKLAALGWKPPVEFAKSLSETVHWTLDHPEWLDI